MGLFMAPRFWSQNLSFTRGYSWPQSFGHKICRLQGVIWVIHVPNFLVTKVVFLYGVTHGPKFLVTFSPKFVFLHGGSGRGFAPPFEKTWPLVLELLLGRLNADPIIISYYFANFCRLIYRQKIIFRYF